ncbi:MAG TPA: hypothetical protein VKD91_08745 [Pyrinomonadaceae bacterium]|nr:hypothetical protein [Pyrinomonadaceae bacterium]
MGIEIQLQGVQPGQIATFTFQNPVQAFVLGMNEFLLSYGNGNSANYIEELQIKVLPGQSMGNVVTALIEAQMHDGSGHTIDPASFVDVVCIAITDTADPQTLLTNVSGISNNATAPIDLPASSGFRVVESFLSGFTLQYSSADHEVLHADAGCGITYQQSNGSIWASAHLYDSSGNQINTALIDAGAVVSANPAGPGFFMQEVTVQGSTSVKFNSMKSISVARAVLKSWRVQYGNGNHYVHTITAGTYVQPTINDNIVTLPESRAGMTDGAGNNQDDSISNVTLIVIAVP